MDSRRKSLSEALLNIAVGFWINFSINSITFPFFDIPWNVGVYIEIGLLYTIQSLLFMYSFRRWFDRYATKQGIKGSIAESGISTGVSFVFVYVTGLLILPHFGMHQVGDITFISGLSLGTTWFRRFLLRRLFAHYGKNETLFTLLMRLCHAIKEKVDSKDIKSQNTVGNTV